MKVADRTRIPNQMTLRYSANPELPVGPYNHEGAWDAEQGGRSESRLATAGFQSGRGHEPKKEGSLEAAKAREPTLP